MRYIKFYEKPSVKAAIRPVQGQSGVLAIDGRYLDTTVTEIATDECRKRGYVAWAVFERESFFVDRKISGPIYLTGSRED